MTDKAFKRYALPGDVSLGGMSPLLQRIYAARGVESEEELDYRLTRLLKPDMLKGIEAAVKRIQQAIMAQERILIVGDFDVDGATSTVVAVQCLRALGANPVDYLVPDRVIHGYGLSPALVQEAALRSPSLIITVDNGISSVDGVEAAAKHGIDVVVTDHHLAGDRLPAAVAIVNPNQPDDTFPSGALAGVGVIFYTMLALRKSLRTAGWLEQAGVCDPNLGEMLDLVALGTVADLVPLDDNNRILVRQGLERVRRGHCRPGITALLRAAGRDPARAVAADFGFAVGPRLNAAGRLENMTIGIECLLAHSDEEAMEKAQLLDAINYERREIQQEMQEEAGHFLDEVEWDTGTFPCGVCLYEPGWHQGVIGILASKVKERIHRPVIAFADGGDGELKGSARSIPGLHIRDVLERVSSQHPGMMGKFGGHAMAAGLSLEKARYPEFSRVFAETVESMAEPEIFMPVIFTDGELGDGELTLETALELEQAGPWGQGFPEPLFEGEFEIVQRRVLKEKHLKLLLRPIEGQIQVDGIVFNTDVDQWPELGGAVKLAYRLTVNRFRGAESLQIMVDEFSVLVAGDTDRNLR